MLINLSIRDIVLIEQLELSFEGGLSVLTGETGAGKSILLDSLSLALGGRGDGDLVRKGANKGQIIAVFDVPTQHHVRQLLTENDIPDDGDIIFRRVQNSDGRTKAYINDQPVSATMMRLIGQELVEIHGQHDDRALVDTGAHRVLLDAFSGLSDDVREVGHAYSYWKKAQTKLKKHRARIEEAAREGDYLRASVEELELLSPTDGEEEELAEERSKMMRAENIVSDINEAQDTLSGRGSPMPILNSLVRRLERKTDEVPGLLEEIIEHLNTSINSLAEAQMAVERAMNSADFDAHDLESTEERLFALRAASRKYSVPVSGLPDLAAKMVFDLGELDAGEEVLQLLEVEEGEANKKYFLLTESLTDKRVHGAKLLCSAVKAELPALKLERADFMIDITSKKENAGASGVDQVEYLVQTNPGTRAGSILKVASGGELSRFLLAIKVALSEQGSAPTLIFDEIDTGVGGAVADAIGRRLKRLSSNVQVVSVTHAPQVAARANNHYLISKDGRKGEAIKTDVTHMSREQRLEEVARMLAGEQITEEARAAAASLLDEGARA